MLAIETQDITTVLTCDGRIRLNDNHGTPLVKSGKTNKIAMNTPKVMPITPQTTDDVSHSFADPSGVSGNKRSRTDSSILIPTSLPPRETPTTLCQVDDLSPMFSRLRNSIRITTLCNNQRIVPYAFDDNRKLNGNRQLVLGCKKYSRKPVRQ